MTEFFQIMIAVVVGGGVVVAAFLFILAFSERLNRPRRGGDPDDLAALGTVDGHRQVRNDSDQIH
jgi:hypothetical protein